MIERCIFVVCLDTHVKSTTSNKENMPNIDNNSSNLNGDGGSSGSEDGEDSSGESSRDGNGENDENSTSSSRGMNGGVESVDWAVRAAHQMLHGGNSENNSGNRWFDKTMQFIISEDGNCGITYEHSPAEGIVVIELSEHLFRYM